VVLEDATDGRGADPVAEFEQFTPDSDVSPARVLPCHPCHQRGEDVVDRWVSGPVRGGHCRRTRRWCQRRIVPGVTRRWLRSLVGRRRIRAARIAWSAQSTRGLGLVRRSTATSCRSTNNSTSLVDVPSLRSKTSLNSCWKIRYDSRNDTATITPDLGDRRPPLVSSVCHVLEPHRAPLGVSNATASHRRCKQLRAQDRAEPVDAGDDRSVRVLAEPGGELRVQVLDLLVQVQQLAGEPGDQRRSDCFAGQRQVLLDGDGDRGRGPWPGCPVPRPAGCAGRPSTTPPDRRDGNRGCACRSQPRRTTEPSAAGPERAISLIDSWGTAAAAVRLRWRHSASTPGSTAPPAPAPNPPPFCDLSLVNAESMCESGVREAGRPVRRPDSGRRLPGGQVRFVEREARRCRPRTRATHCAPSTTRRRRCAVTQKQVDGRGGRNRRSGRGRAPAPS